MPQQCKQPPFEMSNYTKAVVIHDRIYLGGGFTSTKNLTTVLEYDYQTGDWKEIGEQCPRKYFGMAVAKNKLYVVAGIDVTKGLRQGSIYTLDLESTDTIWKEFPCAPMNDNRSTPSVVSYNEKWLIVIGGKSMNGVALDSVEAVNIEDPDPVDQHHWCRSPKLPVKCAHFSSAVVGDHIFTFATKTFKGNSERFSNSVFYAPLTSLVPSGDISNAESTTVWKEIRNLPLKASTAVSYGGSLLALGGIEKDSIASSCIFQLKYNPNTDEHLVWKKIDDLPCALYQCVAVQILDQIFVHGCCETSDVCVYVHSLHAT